jgi:protein phosphatase 1K
VAVQETGSYSVLGTVRKRNEDTYDVKTSEFASAEAGVPFAWAGVYDGHGGAATAEWLKSKLFSYVQDNWESGPAAESALADAYVAADKKLLSNGGGFMGLGERGVGGSKCGATAVNAVLYKADDGSTSLVTANVGDARIILVRDGKAVVLTEEHVPDMESERKRIERNNPNPKMPLVRYVGGTWRVGGLLALSRAFGDAYLKGSLQFEGIRAGGDGYGSGFGVICEPYTTQTPLTSADSYVVLASDGLFAEEIRGGGGGLDNDQVAEMCMANKNLSCDKLAQKLALEAQKVGSTDDVTVVVMRLARA